ncbi:unnamed protein product, partial [Phaeothamnion confervicola]
ALLAAFGFTIGAAAHWDAFGLRRGRASYIIDGLGRHGCLSRRRESQQRPRPHRHAHRR